MLKTESNTPKKTNEKLKKGNITNNKTINMLIVLDKKAFFKINFFDSIYKSTEAPATIYTKVSIDSMFKKAFLNSVGIGKKAATKVSKNKRLSS